MGISQIIERLSALEKFGFDKNFDKLMGENGIFRLLYCKRIACNI